MDIGDTVKVSYRSTVTNFEYGDLLGELESIPTNHDDPIMVDIKFMTGKLAITGDNDVLYEHPEREPYQVGIDGEVTKE